MADVPLPNHSQGSSAQWTSVCSVKMSLGPSIVHACEDDVLQQESYQKVAARYFSRGVTPNSEFHQTKAILEISSPDLVHPTRF
ncbi:hypothetical protein T11_5324 [Trichinella zimbabwensis]|uniref:Uncharacterized protein n=1 Tax=Trichinella zimbabwensis TaxID=268475 RepID=A0A0V1GUG8_9BILA|nr:hypothetical protein T11_5324 [Trichinella zimbabwensis]